MRLPPIFEDFVPPERVKQLLDLVSQPTLISSLKDAAQKLGWKESWQPQQLQDAMQQAKRWMEGMADRFRTTPIELQNCINATGEVFSPRWRSSPLDPTILREQSLSQTGFSIGQAFAGREPLLQLTGAEEVCVVGSLHQAILLLGLHPHATEGWIVPRADCIRLPKVVGSESSADLKQLLQFSGRSVDEVGAANECQLRDLEQAKDRGRTAFLSLEPSMLDPSTPFQHLNQAIEVAHASQGWAAELLLTASLHPIRPPAATQPAPLVPIVRERLQAGADLVILPGDGLIGGPRSAILLGRSKYLDPMIRLAGELGFTVDITTSVGLSAAIKTNLDPATWSQTPLGGIINNGLDNLVSRAQRITARITASPWVEKTESEVVAFALGPQPWSQIRLPTSVIHVVPRGMSVKDLSEKLLQRSRPIVAIESADRLSFAIRTIDPNEDEYLCDAFWPDDTL